jgi:hypothetical protein
MARMFFEVGPFNCLVSSHGYFAVSSKAGQRLFDANVRELGHGIRYRYDDLAPYSQEEIDHAAALDWTRGKRIPYVSWIICGGGDEISPGLGDDLITDALQEWVERHQFGLAKRAVEPPPAMLRTMKIEPTRELLWPDPPPHPPLPIRPTGEPGPDFILRAGG